MDLAANEKAVHADFFNGKGAGIGVPALIQVFRLQAVQWSDFVTRVIWITEQCSPGPAAFSEHRTVCVK